MPQANRHRSRALSTSSGTMDTTMPDELTEHLDALARDDCYRVDAVLKDSAFETTQRVFFVGANGAEQGPYVRKYLDGDAGLGLAYERIMKAQRSGRRFLHVPLIVDCYTAGERRAVVMEYVRGETLADVVYRCDPSVELACDVFPKLCEAVSELHEGFDPPIIHRDLKPSNIMLTSSSLTVIDFGISRTFNDGADEDTRRFGTRAYAPPEQFGYGQTDVRSDVYALGMLLYFCLTEKTPDAKARKNGFHDARVPQPMRAVIVRATAFDPADRYGSVVELERAFHAAARCSGIADALSEAADPAPMQDPLREAATGDPRTGSVEKRRVPHTTLGRMLSRVPFALGVVWDVLLAAFFALLCVVAVIQTIDPAQGSAQYAAAPLGLRALSYGSLVLLVVGPVLYLVSDRRPLGRFVPRLLSIPIERDMAVCFVVFLAGLAVFMVTGQFFPPVDVNLAAG
ncbi:hypothetical protein C1878_08065 [Gordonibacter sp. 28C]|nr:hypothetical protein C1878_08065 [Gordonibacter sp. 28C]